MKLPVSQIKSNPNNPRFIKDDKFKKLVQSLKDFPEMAEVREVVINKDHVILGGNMRFKAMQEAGWTEIPVKIVDWSEDKQREFIIKDNVSGGEWDWDLIANEWDSQLLEDWGLDMPVVEEDQEVEEDEAPEVSSEPPVSQLGVVYQLGRHRVMCGDSTKASDVVELMDNETATMVMTDPPYGVDYEGINNDDRKGLANLLSASFQLMKDYTAKGGAFYCFHSDKCADIFHEEYRKVAKFSSMLIWVKPSLVLSQSDYHSKHEPCLYGWFDNGTHSWHSDRKQTTVFEAGRESLEGHTTPKPIELLAKMIGNSSEHSSKILDLFLGSGSTLIACEQTDRTCYGMELDPKYVDVIRKRYAKFIQPDNQLPDNWEELTPEISTGTAQNG